LASDPLVTLLAITRYDLAFAGVSNRNRAFRSAKSAASRLYADHLSDGTEKLARAPFGRRALDRHVVVKMKGSDTPREVSKP
jgi:hypothetical protein